MEAIDIHAEQRLAAQCQYGRKGIAYDWQAVVAEVAARRLDAELAALDSTVSAP